MWYGVYLLYEIAAVYGYMSGWRIGENYSSMASGNVKGVMANGAIINRKSKAYEIKAM
jgi:hypothetical protein